MTPRPTTVPPAAVEALRRTVAGLIVYPTDPHYPDLVSGLPAPPDVVVVPDTESAVAAAVDVARVHGLRTDDGAARPGDGLAPTMRVLTHRLVDVVVDATAGTACLGPAATWSLLAEAVRDTGLHAEQMGTVDQAVLTSAAAGHTAALCFRVVRSDGFVHVVTDVLPSVDDEEPWIVTAVVVPLVPSTRQIQEISS
ncbi:hypothetical protein [Nocardioides hwasunensis]|uniref:Uncharacterized protein n=1 Tax=Nocardioides hwasunensis TaxID=397258 RepID=A0ABR8MDA9_9ACTN|nr:hypothetical protein [Nocardioides hwasunensis]MBD3913510.1 hypothetical protein [Nocardioides hwasunensis]